MENGELSPDEFPARRDEQIDRGLPKLTFWFGGERMQNLEFWFNFIA